MLKNLMYKQNFGAYRFGFFVWRKNIKNKKTVEFEAESNQIIDTPYEFYIHSMCILCIMCII